jgi:UDP-N-acetylglucosamine/UDP-N-acetylgalactosamine diphosphorylase
MVNELDLKARYESVGQGHVFNHLSELSESEKDEFLKQLESIKVETLSTLLDAAKSQCMSNGAVVTQGPRGGESSGEAPKKSAKIESTEENTGTKPFSKCVGQTSNEADREPSYAMGIQALGRSEVAALVLAGGQGTRLGFSGPKGMYSIGLPSKSTLFQLLSERILKLRKIAAKDSKSPGDKLPSIPFYIMTSPINHLQTVEFFEENRFFGLPKEDISIFQQGMLPCLTEGGKIILEKAGAVAMAPDGNGGIYPSLMNSGIFLDMENRKVKYLHVFSIDNALTRPADPAFIGYCMKEGADCGNKVVWKASAHEKVGVIAEKNGKVCVVEYSDISKEMAEAVDSNGRLQFGAGNICNHFYTLEFLKSEIFPHLGSIYHLARKKIPYYDAQSKKTLKPDSINGVKLET